MSTTITIDYPCSGSGDKNAVKKQDEEFVRTVCAFANSKGGRIVLRAKENERYSDKDADDITRKFEQKTFGAFGFLTGVKTVSQEKVSGDEEPSELIFNVEAWSTSRQPCTVNYKLYLATESQVKQIDSSATVESVVEYMFKKKRKPKGDRFAFGSHHRRFALGEAVPLRESKNTQFKCLKDEKSNSCNIITRIKNNKLTFYISAFANDNGGHIYYGITLKDRQYVVVGQAVENQEAITRGVEKIIKKMLWPKDYGEVKRGKHWEIFFEPVSGAEDNKCNPKFVIVIAVAPSPQPVFTEEPESYHMVDGQVKRLNYAEWEMRLRQHLISDRLPSVDIPKQVGRCDWSSDEAQKVHFKTLHELVQLRNQGNTAAFFTRTTALLGVKDDTGNMEIIVQQQVAAYYFRKGDFQEAERCLEENEGDIGKCLDVMIYKVRRLYWLSVVKRSQGKLHESDELCTNALQHAELIPPMLIGAWLLVNKAKKLEIDIATSYNPTEPQNCDELIRECFDKYYKALGQAIAAQDSKSDLVKLKQRVHINLARIYLGSFRDKETITRITGCKKEDLKKASEMLQTVVEWRDDEGWTMTLFCKCEYLLARCEQNIRNWERFKDQDYFEEAHKNSKEALEIATENNFKSICCYAKEQHVYLTFQSRSQNVCHGHKRSGNENTQYRTKIMKV